MVGTRPAAPADDAARFERIYRSHYAAVSDYALRRAPEHADEVVAETFLVAWRRLDAVPEADALPWLLAVARRVLANARRAAVRRGRLGERLRGLEGPDATRQDAGGAGAASVQGALAHLSERDRELLTLLAWEGLDHEQAAAVLGCSRAAFRVRLHRARRRLLRELEATPATPARPTVEETP